jgi:hypothetical protein
MWLIANLEQNEIRVLDLSMSLVVLG